MHNYLRDMTRRILLIGVFVLIAFSGWTQVFQDGVRKGVVKVKFSPAVSTSLSHIQVNARSKTVTTGIASVDAVAKATSASNMYRLFPANAKNENKLRKHGLDLWYVIEINENVDPKVAVAQFKQLQEVAMAEVEHEKVLSPFNITPYAGGATPMTTLPFNDPLLKDQWHYDNSGQVGVGDADVNLFEAWATTAGASNIIVSVHDQGIDVAHKDLINNVWVNSSELNGAPGVDDDGNGYIDDINGYNFQKNKGALDAEPHGTHVAGTIAAVNNNGIGVSGIAGGTGNNDGVKVMSLQIFGGLFENSYIYAADNGAVISQNSWGYSSPDYSDQSVKEAIDYFVAEAGNYPNSPMKGGLVIFASGNSSHDGAWYPGYYANVMAVSSIGPEWKRAYYSNFGDWVEISAPGGDLEYGTKGGVLSLAPNNGYAYMQGTSMACPHMSGIAALSLASRTKQLTNTELWNRLVTAAVSIDEYNPDYIGKLGSGAIDAGLAVKNNLGIAPVGITNLDVTGIAQEFATLSWSVPADNDDGKPTAFELYYHTQPITALTLNEAAKVSIKNTKASGESVEFEVNGLLGLTTYYFAVVSVDRWGNVSVLSNVVSETTNEGPSIAVDENSQAIDLTIDVANGTSASHEITILNNASGILRWNHLLRHKNTSLSFSAAGIHYPVVTKKTNDEVNLRRFTVTDSKNKLRSSSAAPMAFTELVKGYADYVTNIVGETDLSLTNSSATRFFVSEPEGFNLTEVRAYLKHDPAKGPLIIEIYKGESPVKDNLVAAQEYSMWSTAEGTAYVTLDEQLFFESGETFWVVVHVPSGNLYPLGIGYENDDSGSKNCFISFNLGASWSSLEEALNDKAFAWVVSAVSGNATLGNYMTLEPGSGDVDGNSQATTNLIAEASALINGSYSANMVITSNDANQKELRIPVNLTVTGHQPNIKHIDIADFGNVFLGMEKTLELVLDNQGLGNFNDPSFTLNSDNFSIDGSSPWQIQAHAEAVIKIKFKPTQLGNNNAVLSFTNGTQTYEISLFGMGAETSSIAISPETQTKNNVAIGDEVTAEIQVQNQGAYPLKYFIPGFDTKGVSENWPTDYHSYGYKVRSNQATEADPLPYEFQDINGIGIDITSQLNTQYKYFAIDMGFDFPYYDRKMQTLYVAQSGFTTFDNSVNPINTPSLNNPYNPRGFISPLGTRFSFELQGSIFYKVEADRVIVQYDNVWDGYSQGPITAQMVLFANGDIRFYYDMMGYGESDQNYLTVLIEDYDQQDGILVHNYNNPIELFAGLAIGFDYAGPDIITHIENGSGIIAPGGSATVNITMNTESLAEGTVKRYVNFISNDPSKAQTTGLIQLEVNQGGVAQATVSLDTIAFGNVFQGAVKSRIVTVKNTGTANVNITGITNMNNDFTIVGALPTSVKPGLYTNYEVAVPTATLATLEDWLSINYSDGTHDTVYVTAEVVDAPAINIDLSVLQQTLAQGDSISIPFDIENTGLGTMEVATTGEQWLSFEAPAAPESITYIYEKENTGGVYQWIDIRKTGTQLPFWTMQTDEGFWRELTLPFPIEFYGEKYTSFKIGDNGLISFEEDPEVSFFTGDIPSDRHPGACIMPYWTFSGFSDYLYPIEDIGIFYQFYDDKIIILWSYFTNNFGGMGDPVSAQVIFYRNGTMKFQYKPEEGGADFTSQTSAIGVQQNSTNGVYISDHLSLDHGQGLAYVLIPAKKLSIAPHTTLTGAINIDARNVYGGVYSEALKIQTNVPGSEELEKIVELTVTGDAEFTAADTVDFGTRMIVFEWGSPKANTIDITFENNGVAPYEITWAQMADGMQGLSLLLEVDGFWGKEWTDISGIYSPWSWETPTYTLMPGDVLNARAVFYPGAVGDFIDELIVTTSIGDQRIVLKGSAIEPPVLALEQNSVTMMLNTPTETAAETIHFNNTDGKTDLTYALRVEYRREESAFQSNSETMATGVSSKSFKTKTATTNVGQRTQATYNRTITHTDAATPEDFFGDDGPSITVATKYNAGPNGFNLTHIETWMRREGLTSGTIEVEIRAGGDRISTSPTVAKGKLDFTGTGNDEVGAWYQVKMDKSAMIYPNEDFYVAVTYPFGIGYPQGSIMDSETIPGRYYINIDGYWYNIQEFNGLETISWLMFAAEESTLSWLSITSATEGTLAVGESGSVSISANGAVAQRGDQYANIVVTSNDPVNPVVKVPVTLHLNEGPRFSGASTNVIMEEGEVITLNFNVHDAEGHTFTVEPAEAYTRVTHTLANGVFTVTLSPGEGDDGDHTYIFKATDEHDAVTDLTISAKVLQVNQAPLYIGADQSKTLEYNSVGNLFEYNLEDFFADPDGDDMTFSVISGNTGVADIFASANQFLVRPIAMGETTFAFTLTDSKGAVLHETITVKVNNILAVEEEANGGLKVYPNPVQEVAKVFMSYEWKGAVKLEIIDATGQQHMTQEIDAALAHDVELKVSNLRKGFYVLRAVSKDKNVSIKLIKE